MGGSGVAEGGGSPAVKLDIAELDFADPTQVDTLVEIVTASIVPESWSEVGGPGSIVPAADSMLVIAQTQEIHEQINELFWQMTRVVASQ